MENENKPKEEGIKDLTGRPNKKLTAEQRRNKKQAEAGNYTDINYDGVPDRDQVDFGRLSADLQWVSKIIEADETLKGIFEYHVKQGSFDPESGQQGISNFQNDVMDSSWWKENNQFARSAFALKMTDPAAYETDLENARESVRVKAQAMGVTVPDAQMDMLAEKILADGWNTPERAFKLDQELGKFIGEGDGRPKGDLRSLAMQLRNTASANGLKFSDDFYQQQAKSITLGLTTFEDADMDIREQAAGMWPPYGEKIRAGYNVRDLASGYIYSMASELEIDPQAISLDDSYIRKALTNIDEQGNAKPQSLWQFQRDLRNDPRWMDTNKAQNQIGETASKVMQMFGLVG
jgi:hypothetical protein